MSFVSINFIIFVAVLFVVYFVIGELVPKYQWTVLLAASLIFYISAVKWLAVYLLGIIGITWLFPFLMRKASNRKRKIYLTICLIVVLGILLCLKCRNAYVRFVPEIIRSGIVMPLGISFFSFLSIGYVIDVYRGTVEAEKNPLKYAVYVSFFPHITQGPLDRYSELQSQLFDRHKFEGNSFKMGVERILLGYFKKLIVANNLGSFVESIYSEPELYSGIILAFSTLMYAFQIYADFSGYMDIACGISECMGIRIAENFETPYFSESIAEYWRRWHSTLGSWFRDYLYYPVLRSYPVTELSRKLRKAGHKKASRNVPTTIGLLCTWLLIGFWHGASGNFIAHGLFHGTIIILSTVLAKWYGLCKEKLHIDDKSKLWRAFKILRTFILVNIGYVLFRADSFSSAVTIYRRILTKNFYFGWSYGLINRTYDWFFWTCMAVALLICLMIELVERREHFILWLNRQNIAVRWLLLYIMMLPVACIILFSNVQAASAGNFLYFNF